MANVSSSNGLEKRPKLRFPGFEEPWKDTFFSDLYEAVSEKNDGSFGVENIISVANMYFKEDARITDEEYLKTYNIFKVGDIAFEGNKSNDFSHGRFVENTIGDGIVSHVFVVFRPLHDTHNLRYWKYAINNESVMGRILARCTKKTTMMTNLVTKDFLNQTILCPSAQEQDKIANLLDGISERIKLQKLYVESLKKYKRGLLSNLFGEKITQGCTTKSYYFSEIAQRRSEKYDPSSGIEYPCVELENIEQETGKILATVPSTAQSSIKNIAMPGDTLFGKLRPYLRKYAFAKKTMACSSEIWALIPSDVVLPKFLFYLVQTEHFLRVANISSGTKMPRAEWSNIEKAEFFIPDFSVQRKVVSLLEGLDQKITFADSTLLSLNRLKASLLQHLFI